MKCLLHEVAYYCDDEHDFLNEKSTYELFKSHYHYNEEDIFAVKYDQWSECHVVYKIVIGNLNED